MERFLEWVKSRKPGPVMPQCEKVLRVIQQAGTAGIDRGSIGSRIDLPTELLDQLLAALSGVTVSMEGGKRIYRA